MRLPAARSATGKALSNVPMEIFAASYLMPITSPLLQGGAVAVDGGRIVAVGTLAELKKAYPAPVREYPGCVIMPGLVNAHTHLELTHFPAWKIRKGVDYAPRSYVDWVIQVIKIKRALTPAETELSLREGLRISLESGTTTIGDILTDWRLLPHLLRTPLCGRLFLEMLGHDPVNFDEQLRRVETILEEFPDADLLPALSPHAPHTVAPELFRKVCAIGEKRSLPLMVHLAESKEEGQFLHDTTGPIAEKLFPFVHWEQYLCPPQRTGSVQLLDSLGVLKSGTIAVHCVHVTPTDAEVLRKRGVAVVLCPRSNDRLVVGTAPAPLFKKLGLQISLATDSLASNDSLSLWDEMRFLRTLFPGLFSPEEILQMVTMSPALALRIADKVGSIEAGKRADLLVIRLPATPSASASDVHEAVVESGQLQEVMLRGVSTDERGGAQPLLGPE